MCTGKTGIGVLWFLHELLLCEVVLEGITTNVDFIYEILENQVFEKGEADTGFLEEQMGIKG